MNNNIIFINFITLYEGNEPNKNESQMFDFVKEITHSALEANNSK